MNLEQQVTSIEISKRLKELGVEKESLFKWANSRKGWNLHFNRSKRELKRWEEIGIEIVPAYTVAELGEILPDYIVVDGIASPLEIVRSSVWRFYYGKKVFFTAGSYDTEADARGRMKVYLLENN